MPYLPLKFSLLYLFLGQIYFFWGPVEYSIRNTSLFLFYQSSYALAGVFGYLLGIHIALRLKVVKKNKIFVFNFWIFALLTLFVGLLYNSSLAKSGSLIPYNIFHFIWGAISLDLPSLGSIYYERKFIANADESNLYLSVLIFIFGWAKFFFIPYVIWHWGLFSAIRRIVSVFLIVLPVFTGLSVGTNKPVFDVALVLLFSALSIYFIHRYNNNHKEALRLKRLLRGAILFVIFAVIIFGMGMNSRGVTFDYIEANSSRGNITVNSAIPENEYSVSLVMLGHYLVQGYYGFSLSLNEQFESTLGFGNSPFLSRQFERITGKDISQNSYQAKIDGEWAQGLRWHSAFAQFANDVHFIGVIFVVFIGFFIIAVSWLFAYRYQMMEMVYILPVHGIFVIFLPANNQVFSFVDSLSTVMVFVFLLSLRVVGPWSKKVQKC